MNADKLGLKEVINASGKMTILGVSTVSQDVIDAQIYGGNHFFEMEELMIHSGKYLANLLRVDDAQIVASASAGIAQSVAALIGRGSVAHAYHPYCQQTAAIREIVIPKGHNVDYGTPVEVMIAQGGGKVVEAGYANMCSPEHLEMAITPNTAAILYVKSHHCVQKSMLSVKESVSVAQKFGLPLIVDAAAEEDLFSYTEAGADLVIYSGAKALSGPSSGLVIGKSPYVSWVRLQGKGIGRSMKIGKDNIFGLVAAIEAYLTTGTESAESMLQRLEPFIQGLNEIPHLTAAIAQDPAGREIYRASVEVHGKSAREVIALLKEKSPAIYTREYQANKGIIEFDIRMVTGQQMQKIIERLKEVFQDVTNT
ncbi:MAG: DgaE family pyridoxal phosphate-dependent ammonia lyase [Turicibacter sp.]|nr:DgaE family pyridoxal phosphate-dependent ammonia lyase [Turicibacter sp.]